MKKDEPNVLDNSTTSNCSRCDEIPSLFQSRGAAPLLTPGKMYPRFESSRWTAAPAARKTEAEQTEEKKPWSIWEFFHFCSNCHPEETTVEVIAPSPAPASAPATDPAVPNAQKAPVVNQPPIEEGNGGDTQINQTTAGIQKFEIPKPSKLSEPTRVE
ncbi:unnamed protein product [Caenorhabditis nigoni]